MIRKYTDEHKAWMADHYKDMDVAELTSEFNRVFGTDITVSAMANNKKRYHLTGGKRLLPTSDVYKPEVQKYIADNYRGCGPTEMMNRVNDLFGTSYSFSQMKSFYSRNKYNSGVDTRFKPGHPSSNKGHKLSPEQRKAIEKTMFHDGHKPHNIADVGELRKKGDGYWWVKVSDKKRGWQQLHRYLWEHEVGPIPKGMMLIFKDGNPDNVRVDNLIPVTKAENGVLNKKGYRSDVPEVTVAAVNLAKLKIKMNEKTKKKGRRKSGDDEQ